MNPNELTIENLGTDPDRPPTGSRLVCAVAPSGAARQQCGRSRQIGVPTMLTTVIDDRIGRYQSVDRYLRPMAGFTTAD
jgi:hypothetical protein